MLGRAAAAAALLLVGGALDARGQNGPGREVAPPRGSDDITVVAHLPLGGGFSVTDVEVEQEMSRPYAYVARAFGEYGFDVVDLADPGRPQVIYRWRIENADLHRGNGAMDPIEVACGQTPDANGNGRPDECDPDIDRDGVVSATDLQLLLDAWGRCAELPCDADLDGDGAVSTIDLFILLAAWG